ncbi:hypothetical protein [Pseudonocardia sp. GCM10023141]|uniref:hypothetical protein n=1 Tax=Pseudonocardia sp. GCM10023141 TaxID=3252653 RepID=UPI003607A8E8
MRRFLVVVGVAGLILLVISCLRGPSVQDAMSAAGCRDPLLTFEKLPNRNVLSLSSDECHGPDGALLGASHAIDVITATAWSSPATRFDTIYVTVYRTADRPEVSRPVSREIPRSDLTARYGPRDTSLDQTDGPQVSISQLGWIALPFFVLGTILLPIYAGVQASRAGLVLIRIPGRQ